MKTTDLLSYAIALSDITCGARPFDIDPMKFEVVVADRLHVEA